jgi:hypothetical protein
MTNMVFVVLQVHMYVPQPWSASYQHMLLQNCALNQPKTQLAGFGNLARALLPCNPTL